MRSLTAIGSLVAVFVLAGCQQAPPTPAAALKQLITDIAEGRVEADPAKAVSPSSAAETEQFLYIEAWLNINAEALTHVVPAAVVAEGPFTFTRSVDGRRTYLISDGWPGSQVRSKVLRPAPGSRITMLGWPDALPWEQLGAWCVVETPREMADEENHPCVQAFVFKIEAPAR